MFGHAKKRKKDIQKELEEIETLEEEGPLDTETFENRTTLRMELDDILANEELFTLQQSNERWLLKGDQNTTFFHPAANGKK